MPWIELGGAKTQLNSCPSFQLLWKAFNICRSHRLGYLRFQTEKTPKTLSFALGTTPSLCFVTTLALSLGQRLMCSVKVVVKS